MQSLKFRPTGPRSPTALSSGAARHQAQPKDLKSVVAELLRRTAQHLASTPGGLRYPADSQDGLEDLMRSHRPKKALTHPLTSERCL